MSRLSFTQQWEKKRDISMIDKNEILKWLFVLYFIDEIERGNKKKRIINIYLYIFLLLLFFTTFINNNKTEEKKRILSIMWY